MRKTVAEYAQHWSKNRVAQGIATAGDDRVRLDLHAMPILGELTIAEVRPRHVRDVVGALRAQAKLAPRTIWHVYTALHTLFRDAVVDELIEINPCILKRSHLPRRVDKDPTWRAGAVFTREEFVELITDPRIPPDRRTLSALLGLAGLRFGEAAARTWRSYDTTLQPLGGLLVSTSWCSKTRREKHTKPERPRLVPVHPELARLLADWKRNGWPEMMGRAPTSEDLIIPSRRGLQRSTRHSLKKFHEDLERIGLRRRRQHDLRRTFITLARTDGARKDVLERVTHGNRGDILDLYTELPWPLLCEEVLKLNLRRTNQFLSGTNHETRFVDSP